jgi:hypothetical protein
MNFELFSLTFEMYLSRPVEYALRAVDFEPTADHCLFGLGNCDTENPCPLHPEWTVLKGQIEQWARKHTLNDSLKKSRVS